MIRCDLSEIASKLDFVVTISKTFTSFGGSVVSSDDYNMVFCCLH